MSTITKKIPPAGVPMTDPQTGMITIPWYVFFRLFTTEALVGLGASGYVVSDSGTLYGRTIVAGSTKVSIANGSGVAGNTSVDVNQGNLAIATTQLTGTLQAAQAAALTGDVTSSAGSFATTLANSGVSAASYTVNGNALFTVDAKGRLTSASNATVTQANIGIARGNHTVSAGEDTAGTVSIAAGLTVNTAIVQIKRSGAVATSDAAVSWSGTNITVADGATYVLTAGDVISWIALS